MSVKVGIPGVNKAVSKLQELADRMRSADFGFRNDDVDNIDKIINALYQLEEERQNMRAAYEKESIKAALLRHQSKQILTDVKRADGTTVNLLLAAEKTNKEKIHTKQKQKIETSDNSAELENRASELEAENVRLQELLDPLKKKQVTLIEVYNQRMTQRSHLQYALNESSLRMRKVAKQTVDVEGGILRLKDDLIQERLEALQQKKRLKDECDDKLEQIDKYRDETSRNKCLLAQLTAQLYASDCGAVLKEILKHELNEAELKSEEEELEAPLAMQLDWNATMRQRLERVHEQGLAEINGFEKLQQEHRDKVQGQQEVVDAAAEVCAETEEQKYLVYTELVLGERKRDEVVQETRWLEQKGSEMRERLVTMAEEIGAMQAEDIRMKKQIAELHETHAHEVSRFAKQKEQLQQELKQSRDKTLKMDEYIEELAKTLIAAKRKTDEHVKNLKTFVKLQKIREIELHFEEGSLQKTIPAVDAKLKALVNVVLTTQNKSDKEFKPLKFQFDSTRTQYKAMITAIPDKTVYSKQLRVIKRAKKEVRDRERVMTYSEFLEHEMTTRNRVYSGEDVMWIGLDEDTVKILRDIAKTSRPPAMMIAQLSSRLRSRLSGSMEGIHLMMDMTEEEYAQFLEEEASQESPEEALRTVMMDPDDKEDISKLEKLLNAKKERLEKETPIFQCLLKQFTEHELHVIERKKEIDAVLEEKQKLTRKVFITHRLLPRRKNPLAETREYLREAREAYVVQLKEYGEVTKAKEKEIFTVGCKVRALMEVNERIEEANKKHEAALGKMNETEGIEHLQAELIRQRKEVATLREQDDVMHTVFAARIKFFRDALEPLKREFSHHDKLDDIIRRLLKGMRVLTDFLRDITSEGKPALMPTEKQEDGKQEPGTDKQSAAKRARRELPEWPSQPRCSVQQGAGKLPRRGALKRRPTMHHRALHELCIEFVEDTPDVHVDVSEIDDEEPLPPRDPTSPNISDKRLTLPNVSVKRLSMPNINDKRSSLIYHRRYALPDVSDMRAALLNITGKRPTLPQPDDKDSAQPEVDDKDSAKPEVDDKDTTQPNVDDKDTAQPEVDDKIITPPRVEDEDSAKPNVSRKDLRKPRVHSKRPKKPQVHSKDPKKRKVQLSDPRKPQADPQDDVDYGDVDLWFGGVLGDDKKTDDKDITLPKVKEVVPTKPKLHGKRPKKPKVHKETTIPEADDTVITQPQVKDEDPTKPKVSSKYTYLPRPKIHGKDPQKQ